MSEKDSVEQLLSPAGNCDSASLSGSVFDMMKGEFSSLHNSSSGIGGGISTSFKDVLAGHSTTGEKLVVGGVVLGAALVAYKVGSVAGIFSRSEAAAGALAEEAAMARALAKQEHVYRVMFEEGRGLAMGPNTMRELAKAERLFKPPNMGLAADVPNLIHPMEKIVGPNQAAEALAERFAQIEGPAARVNPLNFFKKRFWWWG